MKKTLISLLFICVSIFFTMSLTACGNNEKQYYGTWNSVSAKVNGVTYTIEELEDMGDYTLSDFRIEIKENGQAYIYSEGQGSYVNWKLTKKGIKIGERECFLKNDLLSVTNNDITIYLSK